MSKKDFELAAKQIAEISSCEERSYVRNHFARFFEANNPRFDRDRFFDKIESNINIRLRQI